MDIHLDGDQILAELKVRLEAVKQEKRRSLTMSLLGEGVPDGAETWLHLPVSELVAIAEAYLDGLLPQLTMDVVELTARAIDPDCDVRFHTGSPQEEG